MRTKKLMFNEKELAEHIYKNGFSRGEFNFGEALLVAKYMREIHLLKDKKLEDFLYEFCEKNDKYFNRVTGRENIKRLVKWSKKNNLKLKDNEVSVYKSELKEIEKIKNFKHRSIIFCFLIIAKVKHSDKIDNEDWVYLPVNANGRIYRKDVEDAIRSAKDVGLFILGIPPKEYSDGVFTYGTLTFLECSGEISIVIKNDNEFKRAGVIYKNYYGGEISTCFNCGTSITKTSGRQKFCNKCKIETKKENWKRNSKKYRHTLSIPVV